MRRLLRYDIACFSVTVVLLLLLCGLTWLTGAWTDMDVSDVISDWRFCANIFWARVFYSFLTVPFAVFCLPVVKKVLTHAEPTGFNRLGLCVKFEPKVEMQVPPRLVDLPYGASPAPCADMHASLDDRV